MSIAQPAAPAPAAPADTDPLLQPPSSLLVQVTNPQTQQTNYAFPLQTTAWLLMQNVVNTALGFPLSSTDFTNLYGTFTDEATVEAAVTVLGAIKTTASQYGDPQTLISQISTFQQSTTPPPSIYGNAVWLASQTQNAAQQIVLLLQQGLADIGSEPDPTQRLADLTALLTGDGGISSYADTLKTQIASFQTKTSAFYTTLNGQLTGPTNSLKVYLDSSTNVLTDAESAVTLDKSSIDIMNSTIDDLNKEYIGFTVAASLSPVLALIPFFGVPVAIADATTFAILATKVKAQMESLRTQVAGLELDEQKKAALVTALKGFNLSTQDVETDGQAFLDALGRLVSGWGEFQAQINTRLNSLTVHDVTDWSAFMQRVGFQTAVTGWSLVASKAETFYQAGFVTFTSSSSS